MLLGVAYEPTGTERNRQEPAGTDHQPHGGAATPTQHETENNMNTITLTEALQDPEALPTITEALGTIYAAAQDLHTDLNIDSGLMGLGNPTTRKAIRDHLDTLACALDDVEQWGDEIIDYAEQTA